MSSTSLDPRAERLLRELAPVVLGAVFRRSRDFAAAEDAVQEALIAAATQWPRDGVPDNPRGWLIHVAQRRITDHVRSETARRQREAIVAGETPVVEPASHRDDTLVLLFMCCHPALTPPSASQAMKEKIPGAELHIIPRAAHMSNLEQPEEFNQHLLAFLRKLPG